MTYTLPPPLPFSSRVCLIQSRLKTAAAFPLFSFFFSSSPQASNAAAATAAAAAISLIYDNLMYSRQSKEEGEEKERGKERV